MKYLAAIVFMLLSASSFALSKCPPERPRCEVPLDYMVAIYVGFSSAAHQCAKIDPINAARYEKGLNNMMTEGQDGHKNLARIKAFPGLQEMLEKAKNLDESVHENDCAALLKYSDLQIK